MQQTLLYVLAANTGDVMTRETVLATIWGSEFQIESNVVDRHIRELRVKLDDDWRSPRYIETVSGKGYRFKEQVAQTATPVTPLHEISSPQRFTRDERAHVGSGVSSGLRGNAMGAKIGFECVAPEHRRRQADDTLDQLTIVNGEWAFCFRGLRAEGHQWKTTGGEEYPAFVRRVGHETVRSGEARAS
jgi:DNA-binding winged helix-turn-helix (wHTH) protein